MILGWINAPDKHKHKKQLKEADEAGQGTEGRVELGAMGGSDTRCEETRAST